MTLLKQTFQFFPLIILIFILSGSTTLNYKSEDKRKNYSKFYFPVEKLKTPKVYHFSRDGKWVDDLFWVMKTVKKGDKTYLLTDSYTMDSFKNLSHIESIKETGKDT